MKKRTLALLLAAIMLLGLLSGCGGNDDADAGDSGAENSGTETLAANQTIQVHWAAENFHSFDNNKNYAAEEIQIQSHVLEGLVRAGMDENGSQIYEPAGAENWETSEDGLTWTFHLREYYWSDGVQVTAQHFVDSFRRLADPRNGCDFASFVGDIVGGEELYSMDVSTVSDADIDAAMENLGVRAVDDTTLEVTLKKASPQFLSKVSCVWMYPVRLDVIEAAGDLYDSDFTTHVWCGPFVVSDYSLSNSIDIHGLAKDRTERTERVYELLEMVGLNKEHANRFAHEFSGGQRQRIGIARAFAVRPEFIMCDEPISALDVSIQAQIVNLLVKLQREMGMTYLFIAHDLAMVKHISDRIAVMYLGTIVELTESARLYEKPLHPYTQALLSAIPIPDPEVERKRRRIELEGDIPSPIDPPPGCRFAGRCSRACDRCRQESPALREVEPGHFVACHLV